MTDLKFRSQASADIVEIYAYSADRFGESVADEYHVGLLAMCERLREYPNIGSIFRGIAPAIRCLIYRSHRIFYDSDPRAVTIVRILHHSRDAGRALN